MKPTENEHFDPETLERLQAVFDEVWRNVPVEKQTPEKKSQLAKAIFRLAGEGERDPVELFRAASKSISVN